MGTNVHVIGYSINYIESHLHATIGNYLPQLTSYLAVIRPFTDSVW